MQTQTTAAPQVKTRNQRRTEAALAAKVARTPVPGSSMLVTPTAVVMGERLEPVQRTESLAGKESATQSAGMVVQSKLFQAFKATEADQSSAAGTRLNAILAVFSQHAKEDVLAGLNAKKTGIAPKSTEAVRLSECNTLYKAYLMNADRLKAATGGWHARIKAARDLISDERAAQHERDVRADLEVAAKALGVALDETKLAEAVSNKLETEAAEREAKQTEANTPEAYASKWAKRYVEKNGAEWAAKVAAILSAAVKGHLAELKAAK